MQLTTDLPTLPKDVGDAAALIAVSNHYKWMATRDIEQEERPAKMQKLNKNTKTEQSDFTGEVFQESGTG